VQKCKKFSKQKGDVFDILARSLAPSIHGHLNVKKVGTGKNSTAVFMCSVADPDPHGSP
jgi:hypothetical protein